MKTTKFVTETGSMYEINTETKQVRRLNGTADPTPRQGKDGEWRKYEYISKPSVGMPVLIMWGSDVKLLPGSPPHATPSTVTSRVEMIIDDVN